MEFKKETKQREKIRERQIKKQTLNYRELMVTRGEEGGEMGEIGEGDKGMHLS